LAPFSDQARATQRGPSHFRTHRRRASRTRAPILRICPERAGDPPPLRFRGRLFLGIAALIHAGGQEAGLGFPECRQRDQGPLPGARRLR
jgi:hypothetical protein